MACIRRPSPSLSPSTIHLMEERNYYLGEILGSIGGAPLLTRVIVILPIPAFAVLATTRLLIVPRVRQELPPRKVVHLS